MNYLHMDWADDAEIESRVRQELYWGDVSRAKEWLCQINDPTLHQELKSLINGYEGEQA